MTVAIGVDVGGTSLRAGRVAADGSLADVHEQPTPTSSPASLLAALERAIGRLVGDDVVAIGLGVPGTVDRRSGRVVRASNLPLADAPLRDHLRERFAVPVVLENDANAAAFGEWRAGAGRGTRTVVMLTLGTGVGSGLVLDGRLFRGATGAGGELGHVILDHDGEPCPGTCTGRGHAEALVAGSVADRVASRLYGDGGDARRLVERARAGEREAQAGLVPLARALGSLLGSVTNLLEPEAIVVGGGFGEAWDVLGDEARLVFRREALAPARDTVRIDAAELGSRAGLVGAGLLGLDAALGY